MIDPGRGCKLGARAAFWQVLRKTLSALSGRTTPSTGADKIFRQLSPYGSDHAKYRRRQDFPADSTCYPALKRQFWYRNHRSKHAQYSPGSPTICLEPRFSPGNWPFKVLYGQYFDHLSLGISGLRWSDPTMLCRAHSASRWRRRARQKGEPGFRETCLRTFEPANARRDAARRDGGRQKNSRVLSAFICVHRRFRSSPPILETGSRHPSRVSLLLGRSS